MRTTLGRHGLGRIQFKFKALANSGLEWYLLSNGDVV